MANRRQNVRLNTAYMSALARFFQRLSQCLTVVPGSAPLESGPGRKGNLKCDIHFRFLLSLNTLVRLKPLDGQQASPTT